MWYFHWNYLQVNSHGYQGIVIMSSSALCLSYLPPALVDALFASDVSAGVVDPKNSTELMMQELWKSLKLRYNLVIFQLVY